MPTPLRYPEDLQGTSLDNRVLQEQHTLANTPIRILVPAYGPVYAGSFILRDSVTSQVVPVTDYKFGSINTEASKKAVSAVYNFIVITNQAVSSLVEIDYNLIGGLWVNSMQPIADMLTALLADQRTVSWTLGVVDKPMGFTPADHLHWLPTDAVGFGPLIAALESIRAAIILSNVPAFQSLYDYIQSELIKASNQNTLSLAALNDQLVALINDHVNTLNTKDADTVATLNLLIENLAAYKISMASTLNDITTANDDAHTAILQSITDNATIAANANSISGVNANGIRVARSLANDTDPITLISHGTYVVESTLLDNTNYPLHTGKWFVEVSRADGLAFGKQVFTKYNTDAIGGPRRYTRYFSEDTPNTITASPFKENGTILQADLDNLANGINQALSALNTAVTNNNLIAGVDANGLRITRPLANDVAPDSILSSGIYSVESVNNASYPVLTGKWLIFNELANDGLGGRQLFVKYNTDAVGPPRSFTRYFSVSLQNVVTFTPFKENGTMLQADLDNLNTALTNALNDLSAAVTQSISTFTTNTNQSFTTLTNNLNLQIGNETTRATEAENARVRMGSGIGQGGNVVHIGWNASVGLALTVDASDMGTFLLASDQITTQVSCTAGIEYTNNTGHTTFVSFIGGTSVINVAGGANITIDGILYIAMTTIDTSLSTATYPIRAGGSFMVSKTGSNPAPTPITWFV